MFVIDTTNSERQAMHTIRSPKQAMRTHRKRTHERSVSGTNNSARHLYGGYDGTPVNRNFAVVVTREIPNYIPVTTATYDRPGSSYEGHGARRSDATMVTHEDLGIDPVILASYCRRANELGVTLYDYLRKMGYLD